MSSVSAGDNTAGPMLSVADAEQLAAAGLPADIWDFVSSVAAQACIVGCPAAMPVVLAPMAYQRMVHPDGELGLASACASAGIPYVAAMLASTSVEQIGAVAGSLWLQLSWLRDRGLMLDLVKRAEAAGGQALVLTVDVPRPGRRLKDMRNGFAFPDWITAANLAGDDGDGPALPGSVPGSSAVNRHTAAIFDPSLSWSDIGWLTERTILPVLLKGILDPGDAQRAVQAGVAGMLGRPCGRSRPAARLERPGCSNCSVRSSRRQWP